MAPYLERIIRAARLDKELYREVKEDAGALKAAVGIVVISSVAAGIVTVGARGIIANLLGIIISVVVWYVSAYLIYVVGNKLIKEKDAHATHQEILRVIGFANSPGIIRLLGIIAPLLNLVFWISGIWMLVALVIAVQQAFGYTKIVKPIIVCVIAWVIQVGAFGLVFSVLMSQNM